MTLSVKFDWSFRQLPKILVVGLFFSVCLHAAGQNPQPDPDDYQLHALQIQEKITLDGRLDEPAWGRAQPAKDFVQSRPLEGKPATEKTEIRIIYDEDNIYVGATCFDREMDKVRVTTLNRDFGSLEGDMVAILFDTFDDDRNGFAFATNPGGALLDVHVLNEGQNVNRDWDTVYQVRTALYDDRWTAEFLIPFKALRFERREKQRWGINFERIIRRKFETDVWFPIPFRFFGIARVSLAGTLVGVEDVEPGRNLKVTPYFLGEVHSRGQSPDSAELEDDLNIEWGVDAKYGVTSSLTLDLTYNTDFSQVEAETQQVNLTRFSLFFPEKRPFFLENRGLFRFGRPGSGFQDFGFRSLGVGGRGRSSSANDMILFFTRRVGLSETGAPKPILGGSRFSGKAGPYNLGFLFIEEEEVSSEQPAHQYTVARVGRDVFANSNVGFMFINQGSNLEGETNRSIGLDGNFRFFTNLTIDTFWAQTRDSKPDLTDSAGQFALRWRDGLWDVGQKFLTIGEDFNAGAGFVPRVGIRKSLTQFALRPRPAATRRFVQEFAPHFQLEYITDPSNLLLTRVLHTGGALTFADGGRFEIANTQNFERLEESFQIRNQIGIESGDYHFNEWSLLLGSDPTRSVAGRIRFDQGDFFNGTKRTFDLEATFRRAANLKFSFNYIRNDVDLPAGSFEADLLAARLIYAHSPFLFFDAYLQYNLELERISSNLRFNVMHRPLSDLFVVYNENRSSLTGDLLDRSIIVKFNYLFDF